MGVEDYIVQRLEGLFESEEYSDTFLLEVESSAGKHQVFIDSDSGVDLETCRKVSRYLEIGLEESGIVDEKYTLEVSSPGLDRPLTQWRQYGKHTGRKLEVLLKDGTRAKGVLTETGEDVLFLTEKRKKETVEHEIPFVNIKESVVQISFK